MKLEDLFTSYYEEIIYHEGLHKQKTIKASTKSEFIYKKDLQYAQWDEQWQRKLRIQRNKEIAEQKRIEKAKIAADNEKAKLYAEKQTEEAQGIQNRIDNFLSDNLDYKKINFDDLKEHNGFEKPLPHEPNYFEKNREPMRSDEEFNPKAGMLVKISGKKREQFNKENDEKFEKAHKEWKKLEDENDEKNKEMEKEYKEAVKKWEEEKEDFFNLQKEHNIGVDEFVKSIGKGEADAVDEYVEMILDKIELPIEFDRENKIGYNPENRSIIVDAFFPTSDDIPKLKSVSYVKTKQEFKEAFYTDNQVLKKYDELVYQLALVYFDRIFSVNKEFDLIDAVTLNGMVNTIDKSTGNDMVACILSVRESREKFESLNLSAIEPKAWFRGAKGVAAAKIANITPVQPIQILNKEDERFVEGYNVIDNIGEGVNLAAIDWQDFENLIREVFEQEFNSTGGEVKITQASRDGGVDAVAFDPDPIRGGKIVIQAKRYTNVVGVSAVRDLYGTIMNEGAMKGILVTTSYYGNDAYEFANGKPIQLIDGGQLLGLLERHGHKARIDLQEAKKLLKE